MASLGHDLKTLRKQQNLDLEEVQQITKIPHPILKSIEDDAIFEEINSNTTYTRNYVRSYARVIGIEEPMILRALNQVQKGTYQGFLLEEASAPSEESSSGNSEQQSQTSEDETEDASTPEPTSQAKKSYPHSTREETSAKWNWANLNQNTTVKKSSRPGDYKLIIFIILVLVCAGGFLVYYYYVREPEPTKSQPSPISQTEKPPAPSDSLREALVDTERNSPAASHRQTNYQTLPDTLRLGIVAASGKLEPVRVYTDLRGKRNPYWVSRGDTVSFNFVNTIQVHAEDQYPRMQLIFNGHIIPNAFQQYYNKDNQAITITRKIIEQHKDWW